jgi:peptidoglycan/xylan/chitin deacetylase (PgdA/CDA1 family)
MFALLRATGLPALLRATRSRRKLTVLCFHEPDPARFPALAAALAARYRFVTLAEVAAALDAGSFDALPPCALLMTFDDGRATNDELVPSWRRHGMRPVVFVATAVVGTAHAFWWTGLPRPELNRLKRIPDEERRAALLAAGHDPDADLAVPQALSLTQLEAMRDCADLQPHTRTHPILTMCGPEALRDEVSGSASDVRRLFGVEPIAFAYPNGDHSPQVVSAVAESGCRYAFTTREGLVSPGDQPLLLNRLFVRDDADAAEAIVVASGLPALLKRVLRRG